VKFGIVLVNVMVVLLKMNVVYVVVTAHLVGGKGLDSMEANIILLTGDMKLRLTV